MNLLWHLVCLLRLLEQHVRLENDSERTTFHSLPAKAQSPKPQSPVTTGLEKPFHSMSQLLTYTMVRTSWPRTCRAYLCMETKNEVPWGPGVLASWHENVSPQKTYLWRCPVLVKLASRDWVQA